MDPDEALRTIREWIAMYDSANDSTAIREAAEHIIESFTALDEWLSREGFLPLDWQR